MGKAAQSHVKSLLVVGGGNMGTSLVAGVLAADLIAPAHITVVEPSSERRKILKEKLQILIIGDSSEVIEPPDAMLLAIKPQVAATVCADYREIVKSGTLVMSCMAGKSLEFLAEVFPQCTDFVRFMPNLPAKIGKSMSAFLTSKGLSAEKLAFAEAFLAANGSYLRVDSEDMIDAATAVAGSGTGYVAYFMEHMVAAAEALGFSYEESRSLVGETLGGAVQLWQSGDDTPAELRRAVTSPGGTTAAAIETFDKQGVGAGIQAGMKAAYERARELQK